MLIQVFYIYNIHMNIMLLFYVITLYCIVFRDYCEPNTEIWDILKDENEFDDTNKEIVNHNCSFSKSFSAQQTFDTIVIYPLNLREENKKYLNEIALKHKIKIMSAFRYTIFFF